MKGQNRFLISYICDNHPNTIEISSDSECLGIEEAERYIKLANTTKNPSITDIRILGLHRPDTRHLHPGHYQQP